MKNIKMKGSRLIVMVDGADEILKEVTNVKNKRAM